MARRKVLTRRLYTYEQLDARLLKWSRAKEKKNPSLYGNVQVEYMAGRMETGFRIRYVGKSTAFTIASIYRTVDGTLYEVHGIGKYRNTPSKKRDIELWKRYTPVFTPHEPPERLYDGDRARYLLRDGVVTPVEDRDTPGIWLTMPRAMVPAKGKDWANGGSWNNFRSFQNFPRRCRLFATRLRKALDEDGIARVQLRHGTAWSQHWGIVRGNALHVCTPPHGTHNGRRLVVQVSMHDADSRRHHHVDGDYAIKHCQFFALEDGKGTRDMLRWKCSRDAINGIKEWIIGDIYIPGPG